MEADTAIGVIAQLLSLGAQGPALSRGRTPSPQSSPPLSVLCRCFEELAHPHGVIYEQECQHLLRVAYQSTHPENPLLFHACTGTVCIPFQAWKDSSRCYLSKAEFVHTFEKLWRWTNPDAELFREFLDLRRERMDPSILSILERMEELEKFYTSGHGLTNRPSHPSKNKMSLSAEDILTLWAHYSASGEWTPQGAELLVLDMAAGQTQLRPASLSDFYVDAHSLLSRIQPPSGVSMPFCEFSLKVHSLYDGPKDPQFSYSLVRGKVATHLFHFRKPCLYKFILLDEFPPPPSTTSRRQQVFTAHELGTLWRKHVPGEESIMTRSQLVALLHDILETTATLFREVVDPILLDSPFPRVLSALDLMHSSHLTTSAGIRRQDPSAVNRCLAGSQTACGDSW